MGDSLSYLDNLLIFHIALLSDLYSNLKMYCFIFTRLLYSVIKFILKMYTTWIEKHKIPYFLIPSHLFTTADNWYLFQFPLKVRVMGSRLHCILGVLVGLLRLDKGMLFQ